MPKDSSVRALVRSNGNGASPHVKWDLPSYLRQEEVRRLLSLIRSPRDRALLTTTYLYGLRAVEATLLCRDDLDFRRGTIRVWRVKRGVCGEKPLFRNLVPVLRDYLRTRSDSDPALFVGRQGRLGKRRVQQLYETYAERAGIPESHRHVHVLRHAIAVHLLDAGEPIDFVQDHLGHRKIESSLVYAKVSDRRRSRTIRRLESSRELAIPA